MSRIFVALDVPWSVRGDLDEQIDGVRDRRDDLRWVPTDNYHVTVRFIGECGPREVDRQIKHWRERAAAASPFTAALSGIGCYPHVFMARVLWARVEVPQEPWQKLTGPDQDPHLTLARCRERTDLVGVVDELAGVRSEPWAVDEVVVMQSVLQRGRAARYEPLEVLPLGVPAL